MSKLYEIIRISKELADSLMAGKDAVEFEETELLNQEDKDHVLSRVTDRSEIKSRSKRSRQVDVKNDFETVRRRIHEPAKPPIWRYAAAAAVLIGAGFLAYLYQNDNMGMAEEVSGSRTVNVIEAGSNKAQLTLGNGSTVFLGKGKSYQDKYVRSDGEALVVVQDKNKKAVGAYNYLTIPRGGQFFVKLPDGTNVWLNSESQLKFPETFMEGETRTVELVYGEAYFDVTPSSEHGGSKFVVLNESQRVEVLGTEFNIAAYRDDRQVLTTLVEGHVVVDNGVSKQDLVPNEQSKLDLQSNHLAVAQVDVASEISWKNGVFTFRGKPLKDIMKVISRWYDVDVIFAEKELENIRFRGVLGRDQNIDELLTTIKSLSIINDYEINERQIVIK